MKTAKMIDQTTNLILRIRIRSNIRRVLESRRKIQTPKEDQLADLLDEAANELARLRNELNFERNRNIFSFLSKYFSFSRK